VFGIIAHMKAQIHPTYFPKAQMKCACGNVITVGSVKEKTDIEICSNCHPFFTGKGKLIDTAGRVERFKAREAKAGKKSSKGKTAATEKK
jgi:large subunit ribosomal protein L31